MKFFDFLLVSSSVSAAVVVVPAAHGEVHSHRRRQQLDGQLSMLTGAVDMLPLMKPAKIVDLPAQTKREGAKRTKVYYGPIKLLGANVKKTAGPLAGMSLDPNSNSWNNVAAGIPVDATLLFTQSGFEFEDGKVASASAGIYNHHLAYVSTKKTVPQFMSCEGQPLAKTKMPATILGATEERNFSVFSTNDYKFDSGFYISADDRIVVTGEVVNYNNETKVIYAVSEMEYVPGRQKGFKDVVTQVLQVNQCEGGNLALHPPPGKKQFSFNSQNMTALQDGYILGGRAHMHDGGTAVHMSINGKTICTSNATYGGPGGTRKGDDGSVWETMSGVTECGGPVQVKKGDIVRLWAEYDLEKHPARTHAGSDGAHGMAEEMAILSFGFATTV